MRQIDKDKINKVKANIKNIEQTLDGYEKWRDKEDRGIEVLPDEVISLLVAGEAHLASRLVKEYKFLRRLENREEIERR